MIQTPTAGASSTSGAGNEASARGLTSAEAARRLRAIGRNEIVPRSRSEGLRRWLRMAADPMVILLIAAALIYAALGEVRDAVVMTVALVPIVLVDLLLEGRAERTLDKLRQLTEPRVATLRDGTWTSVSVEELVAGDVIRLQEGDVLAADCRLVDGSDLIADESALTGESLPISKGPAEPNLFAGTTLLSGRGLAEVVATGPRTEFGKIGALVAAVKLGPTPLQRSISKLVRRLFVGAVLICAAVVIVGLARGLGAQESFIGGVSLAIAAIPEEFPVVYSLYLTLGVWRLASDNALVRRMVGVETLGSTTVICTDKTGTLTWGRMDLTDTWTADPGPDAEEGLLTAAALASEPDPFDPLEQAIVAKAPTAQQQAELVHEYPFDPDDKYMSHIWRWPDGPLWLYAKGALEGVLARCDISPTERAAALEANEALAGRGIRVLAVAQKTVRQISGDRSVDEAGLQLLGLVGLTDPARPEVAASIAQCQAAGIRVVMVTGDHPVTARAVAQKVGIAANPIVLSADALDTTKGNSSSAAIAQADVFARIRPAEKLRLVQYLKAQGETVAMTGDGINDGPALRAADIGVAMGQRGTEVAREAATIVLLDDNFKTIVAAVREGRRILVNVRRAFGYLVAFHVPILLSAIAAPVAGLPLLLEPVHLVWLELVVHPLSSLAFEGDEASPEAMRVPPRRRDAPLISNRQLLVSVLSGLGYFVAIWFGYTLLLGTGWPDPLARNVAFTALILGQTGLVLSERAEGRIGRPPTHNRRLPVLLALTTLSALLPYVPGIAVLMHLQPLGAQAWLYAAALAAVSSTSALLVHRVAATHNSTPSKEKSPWNQV
ncbi:MAG TPA: cation-transporting P-type ATPase [Chloroflexota bacterium]|nr:cation-transporting P-type ATPase [Chloroflexota bacterium]